VFDAEDSSSPLFEIVAEPRAPRRCRGAFQVQYAGLADRRGGGDVEVPGGQRPAEKQRLLGAAGRTQCKRLDAHTAGERDRIGEAPDTAMQASSLEPGTFSGDQFDAVLQEPLAALAQDSVQPPQGRSRASPPSCSRRR